jgi:hypothetical protein
LRDRAEATSSRKGSKALAGALRTFAGTFFLSTFGREDFFATFFVFFLAMMKVIRP